MKHVAEGMAKAVKVEVDDVIIISDTEEEETSKFEPQITSTRIKEEGEGEGGNN